MTADVLQFRRRNEPGLPPDPPPPKELGYVLTEHGYTGPNPGVVVRLPDTDGRPTFAIKLREGNAGYEAGPTPGLRTTRAFERSDIAPSLQVPGRLRFDNYAGDLKEQPGVEDLRPALRALLGLTCVHCGAGAQYRWPTCLICGCVSRAVQFHTGG